MVNFSDNWIFFILIFISFAAATAGFFDTRRIKKRIKIFFNGSKAQDLEELLAQEIKKTRKIEESLNELKEEYRKTRDIALRSIHKFNIVRFNAFHDTGGNQSFSMALLDAKNNGVILSNLYSRERTRIYAKPINDGKSEYDLSDEEQSALKKAMKISPRE
ncbi:MAG: hypothetical protein US76_02365 [Parcubacteria group bacterium GW2011_GWA2_38_13b]|nr:MAG: hypothetical protein US76_02365 [Parcubacteria group bacterium GW2011_GWA2_38_13b]